MCIRDSIYSLGIGLIVGNTMTSAMSHLPKNLQADGNATLQTSVSYTHLDVYKRQGS